METIILKPSQTEEAASLIRSSQLVAFPTETVYGLGANALDEEAVAKIFRAKERPFSDPLIVHCGDLEMAESVAFFTPEAKKLAEEFWPGPLTIVLKKKDLILDSVTSGKKTVGVRIPKNTVALKLIKAAGVPIAAPSANTFTGISPTTHKHVLEDLKGKIAAVIKSGQSRVGIESTVVDLSGKHARVLRPGGVSFKDLKKVLPGIENYSGQANKKSPGQYKYHYRPKARVVLVKSLMEAKRADKNTEGKKGLLAYSHWQPVGTDLVVYEWGSEKDYSQLARRLYAGLRYLDNRRVDVIFCPLPREQGVGEALVNRLKKAAGV